MASCPKTKGQQGLQGLKGRAFEKESYAIDVPLRGTIFSWYLTRICVVAAATALMTGYCKFSPTGSGFRACSLTLVNLSECPLGGLNLQ